MTFFIEYPNMTLRCILNCSEKRRCLAQGSIISQADVIGGGKQCTCAALVFIGRHLGGTLTMNTSNSVDSIIRDGTNLYWSHINAVYGGQGKYLMFSELPEVITVDDCLLSISINT